MQVFLIKYVSSFQSLPKVIKSEPGGRNSLPQKEIKQEQNSHGGGPPPPTQSPHRPGPPYGSRYGYKTEPELMAMQREEDMRR